MRQPSLARRAESTLRLARLRAERDAVAAMAPHAEERLRSLDIRLRLSAQELESAPVRVLVRG